MAKDPDITLLGFFFYLWSMKLTLTNILTGLVALFVVTSLIFYLLWRKEVYAFDAYKLEVENRLLKSQSENMELIGEIRIIKQRRELRDSLLIIDKKHRENEKIKLLENANDSTIDAIIQSYIKGAKSK